MDETPGSGADAIVAKTAAMVVLGLGSLLLGALPMKLASWFRRREGGYAVSSSPDIGHSHGVGDAAAASPFVSLLLCFGGGVLLFTTLLHLQPEVREGVMQLQRAGRLPAGNGFENLGDLIFCAGFFMVFLIDEIVHVALDRCASDGAEDGVGSVSMVGSEEYPLHRSISLRRRTVSIPRVSLTGGSVADGGQSEALGAPQKESPRTWPEDVEKHAVAMTPKRGYSDPPEQQSHVRRQQHSFRGLFAVLALSFHEVFEGLAIGLEERADHVWYLCAAVATHKLVIAFCIGLELAWSNTRRSVLLLYVATFAIVTPVGIGIGIALIQMGGAGSAMDGTPGCTAVVLQGLAAGTLLYVVFFEVLARHKQSGFSHLLAILFGFILLFLFQITTHHNHGSMDDHHHNHHHHQHLEHDYDYDNDHHHNHHHSSTYENEHVQM